MPPRDQQRSQAPAADGAGALPAPAVARPVPAEERAKYIRTMASDMAALAGTSAAKPAAVPPAPKKDRPKEKAPERESVVVTEPETPFFERIAPKERLPEGPLALPSMEDARSIVSDAQQPADPAVEREAILERLRQKVAQSKTVPVVPPAPPVALPPEPVLAPLPPEPPPAVAPEPEPERVPEPMPEPVRIDPAPPVSLPSLGNASLNAYREPIEPELPGERGTGREWANITPSVPSFPQSPDPEPVPPPQETAPPVPAFPPIPAPPAPASSGFHSFSTDFADRIDSGGATAFSVLAAEQDARPVPVAPARRGGSRTLATVAMGIVLIGLGAGGVYAIHRFVTSVRNAPMAAVVVPSIIFADEYRRIEGTGSTLLNALAATASGGLVPGSALVAYIDDPMATSSLVRPPANGAAFVRALGLPAPDILLRNIAEDSTLGAIDAGGQARPFLALRVDSYERTYAGMLTWEPVMLRDLAALYPLYPADPLPVPVTEASSTPATASTTPATTTAPVALGSVPVPALTRFSDAVVANRNVRVLRDARGRSLLLYGYADKRTLFIARDEAAFEALLPRLRDE